MNARPARLHDLDVLLPKAQAAQQVQLGAAQFPATPEIEALLATHFRTLLLEQEPEALFGVVVFWAGFGRGVGLFSERALASSVALSLHVHHAIQFAFRTFALRRLEITVDERHQAAHRWAMALGFRPEGRMERYGPDGSCHWLYARLAN